MLTGWDRQPQHGTNLVGMGAGEPFLAFDSLMKALAIIADPKGLHIVPNRVTVSTAGIVPRIRELATITRATAPGSFVGCAYR